MMVPKIAPFVLLLITCQSALVRAQCTAADGSDTTCPIQTTDVGVPAAISAVNSDGGGSTTATLPTKTGVPSSVSAVVDPGNDGGPTTTTPPTIIGDPASVSVSQYDGGNSDTYSTDGTSDFGGGGGTTSAAGTQTGVPKTVATSAIAAPTSPTSRIGSTASGVPTKVSTGSGTATSTGLKAGATVVINGSTSIVGAPTSGGARTRRFVAGGLTGIVLGAVGVGWVMV